MHEMSSSSSPRPAKVLPHPGARRNDETALGSRGSSGATWAVAWSMDSAATVLRLRTSRQSVYMAMGEVREGGWAWVDRCLVGLRPSSRWTGPETRPGGHFVPIRALALPFLALSALSVSCRV